MSIFYVFSFHSDCAIIEKTLCNTGGLKKYLNGLDTHDQKSLSLLTENARYSYSEIGEIIGLSRREQKIRANAVLYNKEEFASFEEISREEGLSREDYLLVAKLVAILRLANAMDRSHYQKVETLRAVVKDDELQLIVDSNKDFSLELGLLKDKLDFFDLIFGIRPVMKRQRKR